MLLSLSSLSLGSRALPRVGLSVTLVLFIISARVALRALQATLQRMNTATYSLCTAAQTRLMIASSLQRWYAASKLCVICTARCSAQAACVRTRTLPQMPCFHSGSSCVRWGTHSQSPAHAFRSRFHSASGSLSLHDLRTWIDTYVSDIYAHMTGGCSLGPAGFNEVQPCQVHSEHNAQIHQVKGALFCEQQSVSTPRCA